jgi:hypothetical protein
LLDKGPDNKPMSKHAKRRANKKAKQADQTQQEPEP